MENGEFVVSAVNTRNELIEVTIHQCPHCEENIPKVGICTSCGTPYKHLKTFEDFETGFIHYIYECQGCPPDKRMGQKIIKFTDNGSGRDSTLTSDELVEDFLSGGF